MGKVLKDKKAEDKESKIKKKASTKLASVTEKMKKTASTKKVSVKGLKKQYLKSKNKCRVTFKLPKTTVQTAKKVSLAGEFNDWNQEANLMKKNKLGDFTATLELEPGREYQFKYFIDGSIWVNDENADKHLPNPFGGENSVVVLRK